MRVVTGGAVIGHRRVRSRHLTGCRCGESVVARQTEVRTGLHQLDCGRLRPELEALARQTVIRRRCMRSPNRQHLFVAGGAGGLLVIHEGRVIRS